MSNKHGDFIWYELLTDDAEAAPAFYGKVHMPPTDIPNVGRFALVADPQGALFYVMTPTPQPGGGGSASFAATEPKLGHCAWNELATSNPPAALNFYHDLFGWVKDGDMDMGPMGKYEFLRHDFMLGAMMPKRPQLPVSTWTYYFRVADIDVAVEVIKANGGQIVQGPDEIPGGEFSLNAIDPQRAAFALVGPRLKN